jgi:hypothetical protein
LKTRNKVIQSVHPRWFFYPQVITWADIGLAVGGFATAAKNEHPLAPTKYTQASFGLFVGLYLIAVYIAWCFYRCQTIYPRDERLAIRSAIICLPLLAIRTAYSLIFQITGDMTWNAVKGNSTAYLIMTFLTELAIIYTSIWTILRISPPPRSKKGQHQDPQQYPLNDRRDELGQEEMDHTRLESSS